MNEEEIKNLISMFKGGVDDVKLAQELLRHIRFQGKNKYKKYNDLKKRIHTELSLPPCPDYWNLFTIGRPRIVKRIRF